MIYQIEKLLRKTKWLTNRNRFVVWLFGMSKSVGDRHTKGLIMLQVDGLAYGQIEQAFNSGKMPFCKKILANEHYKLHSLYSGVPSSTPAVQGELFYGVPMCVPAFRFKRPGDKNTVAMLEPSVAADIEKNLEKQGEPLLKDGSAYSDIFTGGASESSFCASSLGWSHLIPTSNAFKMIIFALVNIVSIVRVLLLAIVEFGLAVFDAVKGLLNGQNFILELKYVPIRVSTSVLLRELVTIGVKLDAARGLPIIHANFIAYDEQAHRRGPGSKFAHLSLRGIDSAIRRIWRSAKESEYRDYDIWIYSDHGQEQTRSYPEEFGETIQIAVDRVLAKHFNELPTEQSASEFVEDDDPNRLQSQRITLLGNRKLSAFFSKLTSLDITPKNESTIAAMGPLGFVYLPKQCSPDNKQMIARDLVETANIPLVMVCDKNNDRDHTVVWTKHGRYVLPADKAAVFGKEHPFLDDVSHDFIELCRHDYVGDFIISGWSPMDKPMTFRLENGSHAGPGYCETQAFALLPEDVSLPSSNRAYLKFKDLYHSARFELGISTVINPDSFSAPDDSADIEGTQNNFRVMTYNIHGCKGMDGLVSSRRIARVIAMYQPDIVALQEVKVLNGDLTEFNQATSIAEELDMNFYYHSVRSDKNGLFGNAVLSKHPIELTKSYELSNTVIERNKTLNFAPLYQPRGAMEVDIDFAGRRLKIVNTHLGLTPEERRIQVAKLFDESGFETATPPEVLCGDFNATSQQPACRTIAGVMHDVEEHLQTNTKQKTFPGRYPTLRIDHVFVNKRMMVNKVQAPVNHLTKVASDHIPLIVDLDVSKITSEKTVPEPLPV